MFRPAQPWNPGHPVRTKGRRADKIRKDDQIQGFPSVKLDGVHRVTAVRKENGGYRIVLNNSEWANCPGDTILKVVI
jgi:hypothetical protein